MLILDLEEKNYRAIKKISISIFYTQSDYLNTATRWAQNGHFANGAHCSFIDTVFDPKRPNNIILPVV